MSTTNADQIDAAVEHEIEVCQQMVKELKHEIDFAKSSIRTSCLFGFSGSVSNLHSLSSVDLLKVLCDLDAIKSKAAEVYLIRGTRRYLDESLRVGMHHIDDIRHDAAAILKVKTAQAALDNIKTNLKKLTSIRNTDKRRAEVLKSVEESIHGRK